MLDKLTLISCSYNTPHITENMLKSFTKLYPGIKILIIDNSTNNETEDILKLNKIPYIRNHGGLHGPSVDILLNEVTTEYALLVDTDVIFLKNCNDIFKKFVDMDLTLMGEIIGDRGGKRLHKRVNPWHCFINVKHVKDNSIKFYDEIKLKSRDVIRYDVGSSFFQDVREKKLKIGELNGEGIYYKHYEGMSWRVNRYDKSKFSGDIDNNKEDTHNDIQLYNYGKYIEEIYKKETKKFENVDICYGSYVTPRLQGGLGNYLFQIACGYALSLRDNKNFVCFLDLVHQIHSNTDLYFNNIFRNIKFSEKEITFPLYSEPHFHYKEIPYTKESIKIDGYFQSQKYFLNYIEEIKNLFSIDKDTEMYLEEKYKQVLDDPKTCSVHVRRGDYLNFKNHLPTQTEEYYRKAISNFDEDTNFIIFSDDIDWCKQKFKFLTNKIFVEGNKDYQDLYLMSKCKDNIIANSSFSWWGAWLNKNQNKKVIAPTNWFGPALKDNQTDDLYLNNWIVI